MQKGIHPDYRFVVFRDITNDFQFITRSTIQAKGTCEVEGVEYPLINVDISSESHPFYTGTQKIMDTAGRVEKYYKKYGFERPPDPDEVAAAAKADAPADAPAESDGDN